MLELDRRRFLAAAGVIGAFPAAHLRTVPARRQAAAAPFGWGVASFDPTPEGVILWTRAVPEDGDALRLSWTVSASPELTDPVADGDVVVDGSTDHCASVTVELDPDRTYWYAFTTPDGERSPVGRTRTLPADGERPIRLGVAACSRFASGGFAAYRALADREVDLVVHVGDYIYEDGRGGERDHDPLEELVRLDHYRQRYAQHRADPDLQELHARHPMVAVWDDHEVSANAWAAGAEGHDDDEGPWLDRLLAAGQAHEEWLPGRTSRSADDARLQAWRHLSLGPLVDLVVLDTRTWARDEQATSADDLAAPGRELLGADQMGFVADRLRATGRSDDDPRPPWVVLANQVMLHPLRVPVPSAALESQVRDAGFLVVDDQAVNADQWDGYPDARAELLTAAGPDGGVVVLTGDVHSSWGWSGPAVEGQPPAMVELVTPSITSEAFASRLPIPPDLVETALLGLDDDLSYIELSSHGYLVVDLDPERVHAEWWHIHADDPASQRFAAARRAPRRAPMLLEEVADPLPDPVAPTAPATGAATTSTAAAAPSDDTAGSGSDGATLPLVGGAAVAVAAATGALVALRRRRSGEPRPQADDTDGS
jgi:alkaline phosphatase D